MPDGGSDERQRQYGRLFPVARALLVPIFRTGWRTHLRGVGNLPTDGPAIICPNHTSVIDSFLLPSVLPRRITFVGKAEYLDGWKTRHLFPALGMIPIDRKGGDASARALDAAAGVLERGELFGIYPEGTRSRDGKLRKGHTGPARLALRTGAPLVPVGIIGTRDIQPPGARPAPVPPVRDPHRAPDRPRPPQRRPAGAAPAHRRADVRDPGAVAPGVRRRVRHPHARRRPVAAHGHRAAPRQRLRRGGRARPRRGGRDGVVARARAPLRRPTRSGDLGGAR